MSDPVVIHLAVPASSWHVDQQAVIAGGSSPACRHIVAPTAKKLLKALRKTPSASVLVLPVAGASLEDVQRITYSVREQMHNLMLRIIVCTDSPPDDLDELIVTLGVNVVLSDSHAREQNLRAQITSELKTSLFFQNTVHKHHAEKDLLSAIARFSRLEMKLSDCLAELARSVCVITEGVYANIIVVRRDGTLKRSAVGYQREDVDPSGFFSARSLPDCPHLANAVNEARLQLIMRSDDPEHIAASEDLGIPISGRFIFPLRSFGRTMCLVECWLSDQGLQNTSVELMRAIEKSGEQFSLLFERKQADSQLRSQYNRLKHTLDELTSTRSALYHSEKLASLGQLAAGYCA